MKTLQLDKPYIILMVGIPGSGKSHFANQFSKLFSLPYVDGSKLDCVNQISYLVPEFLKTGKTIVVDSCANTKKEREEYQDLAKIFGYNVLSVWVQTDNDTAKRRTDKNKKESGKNVDFEAELAKFHAPKESENFLVLSGKHTFATQTKSVLQKLIISRKKESASTSTVVSGRDSRK